MNKCKEYREMISAMLDGELDHAESERLIKHMSSCAECREMYELFSSVTGSPAWDLPETPGDLHAHIMSGVKSAATAGKKQTRMRRARVWAVAAACFVVVVAVVLGVPRFSRSGNDMSTAGILNGSADANSSAPAGAAGNASGAGAPGDMMADQSSPASDERSEGGKTESTVSGGASSGSSEDNAADAPGQDAPLPEPSAEPEDEPEETEEPIPNMDIAESVVTVESGGGSVNEKLSREDTFIWLRAVIEGPARGIDVAKIEIHRLEGTDYDVYLYHDGSQLMGSLTDDLDNSVELNKLGDFAVFEEMVDSAEE